MFLLLEFGHHPTTKVLYRTLTEYEVQRTAKIARAFPMEPPTHPPDRTVPARATSFNVAKASSAKPAVSYLSLVRIGAIVEHGSSSPTEARTRIGALHASIEWGK